jgi:hypothetical protein
VGIRERIVTPQKPAKKGFLSILSSSTKKTQSFSAARQQKNTRDNHTDKLTSSIRDLLLFKDILAFDLLAPGASAKNFTGIKGVQRRLTGFCFFHDYPLFRRNPPPFEIVRGGSNKKQTLVYVGIFICRQNLAAPVANRGARMCGQKSIVQYSADTFAYLSYFFRALDIDGAFFR